MEGIRRKERPPRLDGRTFEHNRCSLWQARDEVLTAYLDKNLQGLKAHILGFVQLICSVDDCVIVSSMPSPGCYVNQLTLKLKEAFHRKLECRPMPNVMVALPNIGGTLCSTPQSLADAHYQMPCSNAAKMRNPLKFAGVPQTRPQISTVSGPKFTILWGHVEEVSLFNKLFWLSKHALAAKIQPDKVVRWCRDDDFLRPVFQRSACSTFQTCILNSH